MESLNTLYGEAGIHTVFHGLFRCNMTQCGIVWATTVVLSINMMYFNKDIDLLILKSVQLESCFVKLVSDLVSFFGASKCLYVMLHSEYHGQFYESSIGCMPMDYLRKQQQQPP